MFNIYVSYGSYPSKNIDISITKMISNLINLRTGPA